MPAMTFDATRLITVADRVFGDITHDVLLVSNPAATLNASFDRYGIQRPNRFEVALAGVVVVAS